MQRKKQIGVRAKVDDQPPDRLSFLRDPKPNKWKQNVGSRRNYVEDEADGFRGHQPRGPKSLKIGSCGKFLKNRSAIRFQAKAIFGWIVIKYPTSANKTLHLLGDSVRSMCVAFNLPQLPPSSPKLSGQRHPSLASSSTSLYMPTLPTTTWPRVVTAMVDMGIDRILHGCVETNNGCNGSCQHRHHLVRESVRLGHHGHPHDLDKPMPTSAST